MNVYEIAGIILVSMIAGGIFTAWYIATQQNKWTAILTEIDPLNDLRPETRDRPGWQSYRDKSPRLKRGST